MMPLSDFVADSVFCIDVRAEMAPLLDRVKEIVRIFPGKLADESLDMFPRISHRAKIILFKNDADGLPIITESKFFTISGDSSQEVEYCEYIDSIQAIGGVNGVSTPFEALDAALNSDWSRTEGKLRQLIFLFTNATESEYTEQNRDFRHSVLESSDPFTCDSARYPALMPRRSRKIIVAPQKSSLYKISEYSGTFFIPIADLSELDIDLVINCVIPGL